MAIGRSEEGRQNRQRILDFLNRHGPATCRQICDALGLQYGPAITRLGTMQHHDEVTVEEIKTGTSKPVLRFTAAVKEAALVYTTPVKKTEDLRDQRRVKRVGNYSKPAIRIEGPHHIVHRMDDHPPRRNQGGQGCMTARDTRSSTLGSIFIC